MLTLLSRARPFFTVCLKHFGVLGPFWHFWAKEVPQSGEAPEMDPRVSTTGAFLRSVRFEKKKSARNGHPRVSKTGVFFFCGTRGAVDARLSSIAP